MRIPNYGRTSMVLAGILTVLFAGPVERASAGDNDDPVVLNAVADLAHNQLVINGNAVASQEVPADDR